MHRSIRSAVLLVLAVALVGCVSNRRNVRSAPPKGPTVFDINSIEVGPDNTVSWADAKAIIQHGDVDTVFQTHALEVRIHMKDGTAYNTLEPAIDDVIRWIDEIGKRDQIAIATQ